MEDLVGDQALHLWNPSAGRSCLCVMLVCFRFFWTTPLPPTSVSWEGFEWSLLSEAWVCLWCQITAIFRPQLTIPNSFFPVSTSQMWGRQPGSVSMISTWQWWQCGLCLLYVLRLWPSLQAFPSIRNVWDQRMCRHGCLHFILFPRPHFMSTISQSFF